MISLKKLLSKILLAVISINTSISNITDLLGDEEMTTQDQTVCGAITELNSSITSLASDVGDLSDEVRNSLTWKKLGTVTSTGTPIQLSNDIRDLYIRVAVINNSNDKVWIGFEVPLVEDMFYNSDSGTFRIVNYYGSTNNGYVSVKFYKNNEVKTIVLQAAYAGNNQGSSIEMAVYYR